MTQLIELNAQHFNRDNGLNWNRINLVQNRYKYHAHSRLHHSYRYKQPRPTDKLISFIDYEYKKILSDLINMIIIENGARTENVRITNNQIEIILNDQINITV